jgi:hypothetical protein
MDETPINRMRDRARQLRRIANAAHDREMIGMLLKMADEVELDATRLETQLKAGAEGDEAAPAIKPPLPPSAH